MNSTFQKERKMLQFLIVDDHSEILFLLSETFIENFDCEIQQAKSGNEAIDILNSKNKIDFVISDYNMANGSGYELLQFVISKALEVHFIFFTSEIDLKFNGGYPFFLGVIAKPEFKKVITLIKACIVRNKYLNN